MPSYGTYNYYSPAYNLIDKVNYKVNNKFDFNLFEDTNKFRDFINTKYPTESLLAPISKEISNVTMTNLNNWCNILDNYISIVKDEINFDMEIFNNIFTPHIIWILMLNKNIISLEIWNIIIKYEQFINLSPEIIYIAIYRNINDEILVKLIDKCNEKNKVTENNILKIIEYSIQNINDVSKIMTIAKAYDYEFCSNDYKKLLNKGHNDFIINLVQSKDTTSDDLEEVLIELLSLSKYDMAKSLIGLIAEKGNDFWLSHNKSNITSFILSFDKQNEIIDIIKLMVSNSLIYLKGVIKSTSIITYAIKHGAIKEILNLILDCYTEEDINMVNELGFKHSPYMFISKYYITLRQSIIELLVDKGFSYKCITLAKSNNVCLEYIVNYLMMKNKLTINEANTYTSKLISNSVNNLSLINKLTHFINNYQNISELDLLVKLVNNLNVIIGIWKFDNLNNVLSLIINKNAYNVNNNTVNDTIDVFINKSKIIFEKNTGLLSIFAFCLENDIIDIDTFNMIIEAGYDKNHIDPNNITYLDYLEKYRPIFDPNPKKDSTKELFLANKCMACYEPSTTMCQYIKCGHIIICYKCYIKNNNKICIVCDKESDINIVKLMEIGL